MKMYNKEGREANVDPAQLQLMTDNGWTRNKPDTKEAEESEQKAKDEAEESEQKAKDEAEESDNTSGSKKKKRKAIKK